MARTAGIDWASEAHEVCVVEEGEVIRREEIAHEEAGIAFLCKELRELGVDRVAIERPHGVLVERLVGAGLQVLAIHPNQLAASRGSVEFLGSRADAEGAGRHAPEEAELAL